MRGYEYFLKRTRKQLIHIVKRLKYRYAVNKVKTLTHLKVMISKRVNKYAKTPSKLQLL